MIQKGSTPELIYDLDLDITDATDVSVIFAQREKVVVEKKKEDCTITDAELRTQLSREETLLLDEKARLQSQIEATFIDGSTVISNIMETAVGRRLKGGAD